MLCSTCAQGARWHGLSRVCCGRGAEIARIEFGLASNSFDGIPAEAAEFAALQRGWRDFRIAQ
jgi:hypothetical protein